MSPHTTMDDIMLNNVSKWNIVLVKSIFYENEVDTITDMPLNSLNRNDI